MRAKFTIPAELVKAIAKLYSEIGTTVFLIVKEEPPYSFTTRDPARTTIAITEFEPSIIIEEPSEQQNAAFDADMFKRIANTLKREEITFELTEETLVITAEGDFEKRFELPLMLEEPPRLTREIIHERFAKFGDQLCKAVITSEFLREAVNTIKKTIKPDTLHVRITGDGVYFSAPSALHKVELAAKASSVNVYKLSCSSSASVMVSLGPVEAFSKVTRGLREVVLRFAPNSPLLLEVDLPHSARLTLTVSPREVS